MKEEVFLFGKAKTLVGTVTNPTGATTDLPAIILLNAGLVHRAGPNRIYVRVARKLAELGILVFRFDFSGIGDSDIRNDHLPFDKSTILETQEAMDHLSAVKGIKHFVLMGICSGAAVSGQTASCDPRVVGAILVNTAYHRYSRAIREKVQAYYYGRYASRRSEKWLKVLTGRANYRKIVDIVRSQTKSSLRVQKQKSTSVPSNHESQIKAMFHSLEERGVRLLLVYNNVPLDMVYLEMLVPQAFRRMTKSGQLTAEIIPNAGHTFPLLETQDQLCQLIQDWDVFAKHGLADKAVQS
jgi:pimeloyl-ACP methyl ester carboxylesterase